MYTNTLEIYVIDKDETILLFIFDACATEGKKKKKENKQANKTKHTTGKNNNKHTTLIKG